MRLLTTVIIASLLASLIAVDPNCSTLWIQVSTGGYTHTLAIRNDGTLWAWGDNTKGQLGIGSNTSSTAPVQVSNETDWKFVETGNQVSFAVKNNFSLYAWGDNTYSQLGDGTTLGKTLPILITQIDGEWSRVKTSGDFTIGSTVYGRLYGWGRCNHGQTGQPQTNETIQKEMLQIGEDYAWTEYSVGEGHVLANKSGALYGWGLNDHGQLGINSTIDQFTPVLISNLSFMAVAAGGNQSAIINTTGTYRWGANYLNTSYDILPVKIADINYAWNVFLSPNVGMIMNTLGEYYAWGNNQFGAIGDNTTNNYSTPTKIGTWQVSFSISGGTTFSRMHMGDGTLLTWGTNTHGVLGYGTANSTDYNNFAPDVCNGFQVCQSNKCSFCSEGFFKSNRQCSKCNETCKGCNYTSTACTSCNDRFFLVGSVCNACDSNCFNCAGTAKTCTECDPKFYLTGTTCSACDASCENCSRTATTCTSCPWNLYLNISTWKCVKNCDPNCKTCYANTTYCTSCIDGKFIDTANICSKCDDNCVTCYWKATSCESCKSDEYLNPNNKTCNLSCDANCSTCSIQTTNCTSCKSIHEFVNPWMGNACSTCDANCLSCNRSAVNCTSCNTTSFLKSDNTCALCSSTCGTCKTSADNCQTCYDGYFLTTSNDSNANTCSKCDTSCTKCNGTATYCTACPNDGTASEGVCKYGCKGVLCPLPLTLIIVGSIMVAYGVFLLVKYLKKAKEEKKEAQEDLLGRESDARPSEDISA